MRKDLFRELLYNARDLVAIVRESQAEKLIEIFLPAALSLSYTPVIIDYNGVLPYPELRLRLQKDVVSRFLDIVGVKSHFYRKLGDNSLEILSKLKIMRDYGNGEIIDKVIAVLEAILSAEKTIPKTHGLPYDTSSIIKLSPHTYGYNTVTRELVILYSLIYLDHLLSSHALNVLLVMDRFEEYLKLERYVRSIFRRRDIPILRILRGRLSRRLFLDIIFSSDAIFLGGGINIAYFIPVGKKLLEELSGLYENNILLLFKGKTYKLKI